MTRRMLSVALLVLAGASAVLADTTDKKSDKTTRQELAAPATTPEMWLYSQELQRYDDPKTAVRQAAEQRAQQRHARVETLKWFGYSNSRPQVNPTPFGSAYGAHWNWNTRRPFGYDYVTSGSRSLIR